MNTSIRTLFFRVSLFMALLLVLPSVYAQTITAALGGIVSDTEGARIPDAQIKLVNDGSHDMRRTKTNGDGVFQFAAVPPGTYTVTVDRQGFGTVVIHNVQLHPNDQRNLADIKMQIGSVAADITVTTESDMPTGGERSSLISAEQIKKLSTVGRDVTELLKTQPGFAILQSGLDNGGSSDPAVVGTSSLGNYVGNGAPANGASVSVDGANVTDPGSGSGQTQVVNMDMVSEVKIETSNFGADTAKGPTVITVVGKSGTSNFHGSLYAFARTYQLNAQDWFTKYLGLGQIPDRYVYPGVSIGGPVIIPGTRFNSNKRITFQFNAEDYAQRHVYAYGSPLKSFINALVPTVNMRNGNFTQTELANYLGVSVNRILLHCNASDNSGDSLANYVHVCAQPTDSTNAQGGQGFHSGGNLDPANMDPGAAAMLKTMPLPTGPTVNGYNWSQVNTTNPDLYQIRGKVDFNISDSNKLAAVYNTQSGRTTGIPEQIYYSPSAGGSLQGGLNTPGKIISTQTSRTASLNFTHTFNPRMTNEAYAALSYVANYYMPGNQGALLKTAIGYPYQGIYARGSCAGCGSDQYPQLSDYGVHGLPLAITPDFSNGRYISKKFLPNGGDNFTWLLGAHTLKLGVYIERQTANQTDLSPVTNGQITQYYIPTNGFTDAAGTHTPVNCDSTTISGCGANYLADFFLGYIDQFFQQNFNPTTNLFYWNVAWFATDSWKVNKKLTLDYGIRFEHMGPWADSHGLGIAIFKPSLYASDPKGSNTGALPGVRWHGIDKSVPISGAPSRFVFFAPRFGVAYDLYGTGRTIVRGGWGMYYGHDSWNDFSIPASTSQGLRISSVGGSGISLPAVDHTAGGFVCDASGTTGCPSISVLDPSDNRQPLTMTYSFTVTQQMPFHSVFEISYVGNQSKDLLTDSVSTTQPGNIQNINAIPIGAFFKPDPVTGVLRSPSSIDVPTANHYRPYTAFTNLLMPRHIVYANYNALQTSWNKRQGRLNYGLNYTWSKALGVRGGYNNGQTLDPTNFRANYGPLGFDRTHVFAASYSYDQGDMFHFKSRLARGFANNWFLSGITSLQSGPNLQAVFSPNLNLSGTVSCLPNTPGCSSQNSTTTYNIDNRTLLGTTDVLLQPALKPGCDPTAGLHKNQYVNGDCFTLAPFGTNGPANLGYIRGPHFFSSDLTLQKRIRLKETRNLEFRVSAFNFMNHPITAFSSRFKNEASLQMAGNSYSDARMINGSDSRGCSVTGSNCFGYAGYKTGRRVMEVSARFNF